MKQQVSLDIMQFVETQILPRYTAFGESHGLRHVNRVIKNALKLAHITGADIDMVYVIAAYHDLGMSGPRAIHHITGGKILMADNRLKRWFSKEQIAIMKEAVEDHRASSVDSQEAFTERSLPKPTVTSRRTKYSDVLFYMPKRTTPTWTRSNCGNSLQTTWTRNTRYMATSNYGFPTRPMGMNSNSYAKP